METGEGGQDRSAGWRFWQGNEKKTDGPAQSALLPGFLAGRQEAACEQVELGTIGSSRGGSSSSRGGSLDSKSRAVIGGCQAEGRHLFDSCHQVSWLVWGPIHFREFDENASCLRSRGGGVGEHPRPKSVASSMRGWVSERLEISMRCTGNVSGAEVGSPFAAWFLESHIQPALSRTLPNSLFLASCLPSPSSSLANPRLWPRLPMAWVTRD